MMVKSIHNSLTMILGSETYCLWNGK